MSSKTLLIVTAMFGTLWSSISAAQTISNETPVSFGQMVVAGTSTVTVPSSSDTRTSTGAIALVGTALVQRGRFDVTFTPGAQVVISIPGTLPMTGANTPSFTLTLEGGAVQTIPVGGILTVYVGGTINFTTSGGFGSADVIVPIDVVPL